ncbi:flagellar hook-length control protein FliK [Treponema sp.]|uniref:flagellar hook-length control protein FliK n=1 Tax=Treponema sp. TaxID=166 RepID=UPI0025CBAD32|nr:flagellar hook-length control protein FliK [Treponema sp.]MBR4322582.1 flagellar hook-length control protein FliK [Treponema sp.]
MNILSISQVQNNAQADLSQALSSQSQKITESDKPSFADFLKIARRESGRESEKTSETAETARADKSEEKNTAESEKVAKNEKADSSKVSEKKEERAGDKDDKSEKLAQKKSSDEKKEDIAKNNAENKHGVPDSNGTIAVKNADLLALSQNQQSLPAGEISADMEEGLSLSAAGELQAADKEIDDKTLSWLMASSKAESLDEDISREDFDALIDAAVEFIPGFESEEEKLESAQNLAANDPALFLENLENSAAEKAMNLSLTGDLTSADKKIASQNGEKKNAAKLSVHDLRTKKLFDETDAKIASDKIVQKSAEKKEINLSMQKQADGNIQMTMELAARAEQNIASTSSQAAGANGSNFQTMLTNAVQENAPDFVKAGNIVLKDNNQGSINLILRPEGLGNVRISLNLDDKNLSAQITVQTKEAMEAFKESIPSLKQAFAESGFETGSFDLNFSNNSSQQGFAQGESHNQQNAQLLAQRSYGDFVTPETLAAEAGEAYSSAGDYGINIVA